MARTPFFPNPDWPRRRGVSEMFGEELPNAAGWMGFFGTLLRIVAGDILNSESKAERQGRIGEEWVWDALSNLPDDFNVVRNALVPSGDGTIEIDAVVFSQFGVFVIEVKTMSGKIYAPQNGRAKRWQVYYRGRGNKRIMQNPVHQNYKHIRALQEITGLPQNALHSVVVFLGECEFKTPVPDGVMRLRDMRNHILSKRGEILTKSEVSNAKLRVDMASNNSPLARKRHAESLRARHQ